MRILPVLDLMNGVVVRGIGGRREEYKPVISRLTDSARPLDVAHAFREQFGFDDLYVADLDAIAGLPPALMVYRELLRDGFRLWVDAGMGTGGAHPEMLAAQGVTTIIAGLESLHGPEQLGLLVERYSSRLVFSLDMKNGVPLAGGAWGTCEPWNIAEQTVGLGVRRLLVLDLASVGSDAGPSTQDLCRRLRTAFPNLELIAGGGVRGIDDLVRLKATAIDWVLIASALHDGRLGLTQIKAMEGKRASRPMW